MRRWLMAGLLSVLGCGGARAAGPDEPDTVVVDASAERGAIDKVIDDWHAAAAEADEARYFSHLTEDAVFLGTDATERWDKAAFRVYAHPHFAKGKAWSFTPTRRAVIVDAGGEIAWFDEDLDTPNLGPARGSGVLRKVEGTWRIAHYNLAITVPNERFAEVRKLLGGETSSAMPTSVSGRAVFAGEEPFPMDVPKTRKRAFHCKDTEVKHNAVRVSANGGMADVLVRLPLGAAEVKMEIPPPARVVSRDCVFEPRMQGIVVGQKVSFENADPMMVNVQAKTGTRQVFNVGLPRGAAPYEHAFDEPGFFVIQSSVQPWMRAFIWVSDHPFVAVSDEKGAFEIRGVPDGDYTLEAWHSFWGKKTQRIRILNGRAKQPVLFQWDGSEEEPPENYGEMDDLF